jgi:hypothetical protein
MLSALAATLVDWSVANTQHFDNKACICEYMPSGKIFYLKQIYANIGIFAK